MISDYEIVKNIEEVNFPNVVEVEIDSSLYILNVNNALHRHAVFFCIDNNLQDLERKFFKGVESLMDSIVEGKIKCQDEFYNCFSNAIIILYRYEDVSKRQQSKRRVTLPSATKHLKNNGGLTICYLQHTTEVKNKFEPWRRYKQEGMPSFSIMTRLNKVISPSRTKGGCIDIEVLISQQPANHNNNDITHGIFLLNGNLLDQIENQQLLFGALLNLSVVLKLQLEQLARLVGNNFLNFSKHGNGAIVTQPPSMDTPVELDSETGSTTTISDIPESIWIGLCETFFFSNDIFSMRMFATCSKYFYKLVSINIPMAICKLPMLNHTLDKEEQLNHTVKNIHALIDSQKEHKHTKISVSTGALVTAIHNMDRILALSGGYSKEIVLKITKEKNEAKSLYIKAKNDEDLLENVKQFYIQMYNKVLESYGVFINNSLCRSKVLNDGNAIKMNFAGYIQIPPKCNGTTTFNTLQTQILSNIGQCCLKQNNKYDEKRYTTACKYLSLALLYTPNDTKTLWRLGMNEMKYHAFKVKSSNSYFNDGSSFSFSLYKNKLNEMFTKANGWYIKAKNSTNKQKELRTINKSIRELNLFLNFATKKGLHIREKMKRSTKEIEAHHFFMEDLGKTAQSRGYMPDLEIIESCVHPNY